MNEFPQISLRNGWTVLWCDFYIRYPLILCMGYIFIEFQYEMSVVCDRT